MEITFYRNGKRYYYCFNNQECEINEITLNKLKEKLKLPFTAIFGGMSIAQVQKICSRLNFDNITYSFQTKDDKFEVHFVNKKQYIDAYCITSKACLYGRNPNCKPYIINMLGDKKILMEVTHDFLNACDCDYYFLHSELTSDEQLFFGSRYESLEVDYV